MGKRVGRPSWFKMFLHQKALIDSVPDKTAGVALKAAFRYFDTQELEELEPLAFAVFSVIKPYIDESFEDFQAASEKNRENIRKRWRIPSDTTGTSGYHSYHSIPSDTKNTEADAEAETDTEEEEDCCCFPAVSEKTDYIPPTIDEIREYCDNNNYTFDPVYFESYYRARGWMLGNVHMQDWKAVADNWQQKEGKPNGQTEHRDTWQVGTVV